MKENRKIKWKSNDDCCEKSKIFIEILSNISSKLVNINLRKEYLIEECLEELGEKRIPVELIYFYSEII